METQIRPAAVPAIPAPVVGSRHAQRAITVGWAKHLDEVRQAQRLRHTVFAEELGARLSTPLAGHDIDRFDDFCEHLLVRDAATQAVVGTYRVLTPTQARRAGGGYCDTEFDLAPLRYMRPKMAELGRSCVHRDHRHGAIVLALWRALAEFARRNRLDTMVGCVSIPMHYQGVSGGQAAAGIWQRLRQSHLAPLHCLVQPRLALPVDGLASAPDVTPPPLVGAYLRLGARVLGAPAWDPDFNTADLPMLMQLHDLPAHYRCGVSHA